MHGITRYSDQVDSTEMDACIPGAVRETNAEVCSQHFSGSAAVFGI